MLKKNQQLTGNCEAHQEGNRKRQINPINGRESEQRPTLKNYKHTSGKGQKVGHSDPPKQKTPSDTSGSTRPHPRARKGAKERVHPKENVSL
jgi:hypothetical protein